jgi:CheY-like chemotaxis protein
LGLAIVEGLARAMSVDVGLASVPGRGSVFRLTLPLSQDAVLEETAVPAIDINLTGVRVLLIDDDETVRVAMAELLTVWGCWCEVVASQAEALHLLARFAPDVVLADFRLRDHRTGPQAIEAVRAQSGRAVPAIIITGDTAADRLRAAADSGMTLLHKPVGSMQLQRALAQALGAQPLHAGSHAGSHANSQADAPSA